MTTSTSKNNTVTIGGMEFSTVNRADVPRSRRGRTGGGPWADLVKHMLTLDVDDGIALDVYGDSEKSSRSQSIRQANKNYGNGMTLSFRTQKHDEYNEEGEPRITLYIIKTGEAENPS